MTARRIDGRWYVDFRFDRRRVRRTSPVNTKRGAEEYERLLLGRLMRGEPLDGKPEPKNDDTEEVPLYKDFAQEFLRDYVEAKNKVSEQNSKRTIIRKHLLPAFGHLRLDAIRNRQIDKFKAAKIREGYTAKSVNNYLTCLRKSLACAVDWEYMDAVPRFEWLKTPPPSFDFFTIEETEQLLLHVAPEYHAMVFTAVRTGLRRGELLALRWSNVDFFGGKIHVVEAEYRRKVYTPKSNRRREVPMSPRLMSVLKSHRHLRGELVFCREDGSMLTKDMVKRVLPLACRKAGLRTIQWHALRHSFASQLVMAGVPLRTVQELLGHATLEMTLRYAHLAPAVLHEAVATLDAATGRGQNMGRNGG